MNTDENAGSHGSSGTLEFTGHLFDSLVGFSLDIKSAHKLVVIQESDRGLLGFTLDNAIYFYKVAPPFGATFSAFHWTRLGSFILRCLHCLLWWSHGGFLYVDDFFFIFPKKVAWIMACLCCLMAQILNIPISWRKTEFGPRVQWIGWQFHITAAWTSKKSLEKLVELLNWVTQIFSLMRCWLPVLYKDLYHIPASHYSIDPGHQAVQCKADLHQFYLSERRTWLRLRDPKSIR